MAKTVKYSTIFFILIVVIAVTIAGCSSTKSGSGTTPASNGAGSSASGGNQDTPPASGGTCPAASATNSWTGTWLSWSNENICYDGRALFYPPTADNPDPWEQTAAGVEDFPVKFTQTGCDVTGSITVGPNGTLVAPPGCPITLTGKVDSTGAVSGTWHAYCAIETRGAPSSDGTTESGSFSLNMEPGGSTFVGSFGPSAADTSKYKTDNCPNANSNWVGKRGAI